MSGMYAVNVESTDALVDEFDEMIDESERLCAIVDPEETPFKSKYEARVKLDTIVNKLEATKTVATLEKNHGIIVDMNWRIACIKVKLGSISLEVEEPHNAQSELDSALEFYFPGFIHKVNTLSGELSSNPEDSNNHNNIQINESELSLPSFDHLPMKSLYQDAMRCLNMLGILWAARSHHKRSFIYFYTAKEFYSLIINNIQSHSKDKSVLESLYTHNLFYLAQAYGNNGNANMSCKYCKETLSRQLIQGFSTSASKLEWIKNCQGISDFYLAIDDYKSSLLVLLSAEKLLSQSFPFPLTKYEEEDRIELAMNLQRRFIKFDLAILKDAYDERNREKEYEPKLNESTTTMVLTEEFFPNLAVSISGINNPSQIILFDDARVIFLRAVNRIESCKQHFVMEGYVTDHIALVEDHSKLYLYLQGFEKEPKRKQAMHTRRIEMLQPFLNSISRTAYDVQHKQISYEVGETYMLLFELKVGKLREKRANSKTMKPNDVSKCNEYTQNALASFVHFLLLYVSASAQVFNPNINVFTLDVDQLMKLLSIQPDDANISNEEIRPFLNAHFYCCRILSKIIPPQTVDAIARSKYVVAAKNHFEWLSKRAPGLCDAKKISIDEVFGDEYRICREMVDLLPSKINRIHYFGEDSIDLW